MSYDPQASESLNRFIKEFPTGDLLVNKIILFQPLPCQRCGFVVSPHCTSRQDSSAFWSHTFSFTCPGCFCFPWLWETTDRYALTNSCCQIIGTSSSFLIMAIILFLIVPAIQSCAACHPSCRTTLINTCGRYMYARLR